MPHNTERLSAGKYRGYGSNTKWEIKTTNSSYGNWIAVDLGNKFTPIYAFTLKDIAAKIENATRIYSTEKTPRDWKDQSVSIEGKKNPRKKSVAVSTMYLEGIKEGRHSLNSLRQDIPDISKEQLADVVATHIRSLDRLMKRADLDAGRLDLLKGQRDFWEGQRSLTIRGTKNPAPKFGKRKSTPAKSRKVTKKKRATFGKRRVNLTGPRGNYVVRAVSADGSKFYWDGLSFDSRVAIAARYVDHKQAERVLASIEDRLPRDVSGDVVTV